MCRTITIAVAFVILASSASYTQQGNRYQARQGVPGAASQTAPEILSPMETLKAYYRAATDKDAQGMRRYLSKGTIELMEKGAKMMGKSLDVALEESSQYAPPTPTPIFDNEKIDGDTATVDITSEGRKMTMPFVKEGGQWKIALDKFIINLKAEMERGLNPPLKPGKNRRRAYRSKRRKASNERHSESRSAA
ncbi:MAG: hypothetical protein QOH63_2968 [Acidobacteriota bacterium]|jgi:hypothetical protein|nr:hypothetical protein [Acidobacteriota bacterium]